MPMRTDSVSTKPVLTGLAEQRRVRFARQAAQHRARMRARHKAVENGPAMAGHAKLDREFDERIARELERDR
jgi:hypothetical protein